ncbi:MAG: BCD family MFS transporter [Pseudomonadota bacterium]
MTAITDRAQKGLSWLAIVRLGLVQASIGSIVVLTTSVLNRVMVVELALAAVVHGMLVGLHYAVQMSRPLWGHASDNGARRTAYIIGGIAFLALGGVGAASTTLLFETNFWLGLTAAALAFTLIGFGIGASGTSLLAMLASKTAQERRPAAATIAWMLMIAGIVITAIISSGFLEPYSHERLIMVTATSGLIATIIATLAVWGVEKNYRSFNDHAEKNRSGDFKTALRSVWNDREARIFTVFVFFSMLAYQTQDLILEPFGGLLFDMTPAETTRISGSQHGGVLMGMAVVGVLGTVLSKRFPSILKWFTVWGCVASAAALIGLAYGATVAPNWPLSQNIFLLGFANGIFAVAAIGTMMALAGRDKTGREGIRMGVWGAAQAIAFGIGGFAGTVALDIVRYTTGSEISAFLTVFSLEAGIFIISALIAIGIKSAGGTSADASNNAIKQSGVGLQPAE